MTPVSMGRPGGGGGVGGGGSFGAASNSAKGNRSANSKVKLIGTIFIGCKSK